MPSKMVGAESAALSASRMSNERSAGELHSQRNGAGERNRTVVSALARPHSAVEPHPQRIGVPSWTLTSNLALMTRLLSALSYGSEFEMVRASGNAPEPGTDLVRCG